MQTNTAPLFIFVHNIYIYTYTYRRSLWRWIFAVRLRETFLLHHRSSPTIFRVLLVKNPLTLCAARREKRVDGARGTAPRPLRKNPFFDAKRIFARSKRTRLQKNKKHDYTIFPTSGFFFPRRKRRRRIRLLFSPSNDRGVCTATPNGTSFSVRYC